MNLTPTQKGNVIFSNCRKVLPQMRSQSFDMAIIDPPYGDYNLYDFLIEHCARITSASGAMALFLYPEDIASLGSNEWIPDQIVHWLKPVSTKNTSKRYSSFIEAIAIWHGNYFNQDLHWSCRTGVFTDSFIEKPSYSHKKPESLIEKLLLLHCLPGGSVIDPCAGTGTTMKAARKHGFKSLNIEINEQHWGM